MHGSAPVGGQEVKLGKNQDGVDTQGEDTQE